MFKKVFNILSIFDRGHSDKKPAKRVPGKRKVIKKPLFDSREFLENAMGLMFFR